MIPFTELQSMAKSVKPLAMLVLSPDGIPKIEPMKNDEDWHKSCSSCRLGGTHTAFKTGTIIAWRIVEHLVTAKVPSPEFLLCSCDFQAGEFILWNHIPL